MNNSAPGFTPAPAAAWVPPVNQREYLNHIVINISWYYSGEEITLEQIEDFMQSLAIDDLDPKVVKEVYDQYLKAPYAGNEIARRYRETA